MSTAGETGTVIRLEARNPERRFLQRGRPGRPLAAWDEPALFSTEIRAAFTSLRQGRLS